MSMQIPNCTLNLTNIGKYLNIDDNIIGIKYNFGKESIMKGKYMTTIYKKSKIKNEKKINKSLFYNQISIILQYQYSAGKERTINIKLFGNGSLHLTGVKDPSEGKIAMLIIYKKLIDLIGKYNNILLTLDVNNIYIDNNNNVYNSKQNMIIGYKYLNVYNINNKDYEIDIKTGYFIAKKFENKRTKRIVDFDGIDIGFSKIELLKNKSKLYKNNTNVNIDYTNGFIYYDGYEKSSIIGSIVYNININPSKGLEDDRHLIKDNVIECKYNCNPFYNNSIIYNVQELDNMILSSLQYDINCINIYLKLDYQLNRQRLFNAFIEKKFICEYKPEKYSGIKLRYKISRNGENDQQGICKCNITCTCTTITFLIFQSGNIIAVGFKSIQEINGILNEFENIMKEIKPIIKKKII